MLALEPQRYPAGDEHAQLRAGREQPGYVGRAGCQMLEVVEQQQRRHRFQTRDHRLFERAGGIGNAERLCKGGDDQRGIGKRRQVNEEDPVPERALESAGRLQCQPGFACAAGPRHGHEPCTCISH